MENHRSTYLHPDELQFDTRLYLVLLVVIGLFLLTVTAFVSYRFGKESVTQKLVPPTEVNLTPSPSETNEGTICTMDAKICPDGSSVGRSGPNCEFAACPSTNNTATQSALPPDSGRVCPRDIKTCSDGTYVVRTGPNCEFALCPTETSTPDYK